MLTKRQKEILDYIYWFIKKYDYSPSLEEIARHFDLSSVATVHEHITALRDKHYLSIEENHPRSINVYGKEDIKGQITLPLLGIIAAGSPMESIKNFLPVS